MPRRAVPCKGIPEVRQRKAPDHGRRGGRRSAAGGCAGHAGLRRQTHDTDHRRRRQLLHQQAAGVHPQERPPGAGKLKADIRFTHVYHAAVCFSAP